MTRRRSSMVALLWAGSVFCLSASGRAAKPGKRKQVPPPTAPSPELPSRPSPAESAGSITVTVVEVAGTQAYLAPGASAGVRRGAKVIIGQKEYEVVQATDSFAAIIVGPDPPHAEDKGRVAPMTGAVVKVVQLEKPTPLSTWQHEWPDPVPPATTETPRFVPLGDTERDGRWDVRLSASGGALLPLGPRGSNLAHAELDARVHARPFDAPAALDLDVALERFFDPSLSKREGSAARPTVYVRELLASYSPGGFYAGVGRMRYAASTLGALDGARASAPLGEGVSVGAFGGLLPEPLSAAPSLAASRFGVEAAYRRPDAPLRPDAALVVQGSTFQGKLDERRISGVASLYPGPSRFGAHFEVSGFDASNPWKAKAVELTAAGFDSSVRVGKLTLEGRFDVRQPERSRWLASYLPAAWFCSTVPLPAGARAAAEPCNGGVSTMATGAVDAGVEIDRWSFVVGGTTIGDLTQSGAANALGAFATARVVRIGRVLRFDASGNYTKATYADMLGAAAGPGFTLFGDVVDLSAYYRAAVLEYRSVSTSLVEHAAGGTLILVPDSTLVLAVQGEALAGADTPALMLFGTATWHPRL